MNKATDELTEINLEYLFQFSDKKWIQIFIDCLTYFRKLYKHPLLNDAIILVLI